MAAAGDINKDGYVDFFLAGRDAGQFAVSDGRGGYVVSAADRYTAGANAAQFVDYDNDGLLDLLAAHARRHSRAPEPWRALAGRHRARSRYGAPGPAAPRPRDCGDVDSDGDIDALFRTPTEIRLLRNDGGNRHRSVRVQLTARVSNRSAVGAKIELRAGSLRQRMETYAATPSPAPADIAFGLGDRAGADVVRVLWPSGTLQAEAALPRRRLRRAASATSQSSIASRRPVRSSSRGTARSSSSSPTSSAAGKWATGRRRGCATRPIPTNTSASRRQAAAARRRLELRVTNELEEALFVDRAQLVAVAHPARHRGLSQRGPESHRGGPSGSSRRGASRRSPRRSTNTDTTSRTELARSTVGIPTTSRCIHPRLRGEHTPHAAICRPGGRPRACC